jgi:hypothetical protein
VALNCAFEILLPDFTFSPPAPNDEENRTHGCC